MRYQMFYNERGERLWLPILAGAAIISAPLWLNGRQCYGNNCYNNQQPMYNQQVYPYPYPYSYPYPYPYPNYQYPYQVTNIQYQ